MIEWLINTIRHFQDNGILEVLQMAKIFEQERIQELEQELQFTQMCIGRLSQQDFNYHAAREGQALTYKALEQMRMNKIRLEVEIATLTEFLEG